MPIGGKDNPEAKPMVSGIIKEPGKEQVVPPQPKKSQLRRNLIKLGVGAGLAGLLGWGVKKAGDSLQLPEGPDPEDQNPGNYGPPPVNDGSFNAEVEDPEIEASHPAEPIQHDGKDLITPIMNPVSNPNQPVNS